MRKCLWWLRLKAERGRHINGSESDGDKETAKLLGNIGIILSKLEVRVRIYKIDAASKTFTLIAWQSWQLEPDL